MKTETKLVAMDLEIKKSLQAENTVSNKYKPELEKQLTMKRSDTERA